MNQTSTDPLQNDTWNLQVDCDEKFLTTQIDRVPRIGADESQTGSSVAIAQR
jgi:hypothetical protein